MPRNIRPSFIHINTGSKPFEGGPASRNGSLVADLKVRNQGSILDLLNIAAIASNDGQTVLVEVTDRRTGKVIFSEEFAQ